MQHDILTPPAAPNRVPVVLDTDTANEIDDQFAVVHALLSQDRLQLEAIYATLFTREGQHARRGRRRVGGRDSPAAGAAEASNRAAASCAEPTDSSPTTGRRSPTPPPTT